MRRRSRFGRRRLLGGLVTVRVLVGLLTATVGGVMAAGYVGVWDDLVGTPAGVVVTHA